MSRGRTGVVFLALTVALVLTSCGGPAAPTSPTTTAAPTALRPTAAPTSTAPPCPDSPPGDTLPSPLPPLGDILKIPGSPCSARYQGIADVRGLSTFTLTIGHTGDRQLWFAPTLLKGTPGESLKLHIVDTTHHLHNISIPDQGVNVDIPVDGAVDVVATFPPRGPTVYFWSYHDVEGQAGELFTVSP